MRQVGMMEHAERHAEIAARLAPDKTDAWLILADMRRRKRDLQGAMNAYKAAIKADPNNGPAIGGLASLYITFGWRKEAAILLGLAAKKRPGDLPLKVATALSHIQNNDYARAEETLLEVKAAAENDFRLWAPLINLYNLQKRYRDAAGLARRILDATPHEVTVRNELGIALYRLAQTETAAEEFSRVISEDSQNLTALYYLALCHQRMGNLQRAVERMETVYRTYPAYEQTRQILGQLYLKTGRTEEGEKLLSEFKTAQNRANRRARLLFRVDAMSNDPQAHYDAAREYAAGGDRPLAEVELRRALELAPGYKEAAELLKSVERR
jgi:tetratricopeptide (TPR) repeat protein